MTPTRALELLRAADGTLLDLLIMSDDEARDVLCAYAELDVDSFTDALRAIAYGADSGCWPGCADAR